MQYSHAHTSHSISHPGVRIFAAFAGVVLALPVVAGIAGLLFLGS